MKRVFAVVVFVCSTLSLCLAQRLPHQASPENYKLTFTPNLEKATFEGDETISIRVLQPTSEVTLNAADIDFHDVTITSGGIAQPAKVTPEKEKEMVVLAVEKPLPAGPATIHIPYSGILNSEMRGFYIGKDDQGRKYAATQFESTDARRAYPSFDEPAYKATFDIAAVIDKNHVAISNQKIASDTPAPGDKHTVRFATTVKMSSYLAALVVGTRGQSKIAWFSAVALLAIFILFNAGRWYQSNLFRLKSVSRRPTDGVHLSRLTILSALAILVALIFSKYFYLASISSYYTFYLIDRFHLTIEQAQLLLFLFTFSVAAGTIVGGPIGDRIGRKYVIWVSILGVAPFTLLLPHANLPMTAILSVIIGFILSSAFSAILVYAQELMPGKVGLVSGIFFGFAFGMGGIGSALLGQLIDLTNIRFVFQLCAFLPLLGLLTAFLPEIERKRAPVP